MSRMKEKSNKNLDLQVVGVFFTATLKSGNYVLLVI